MASGAGGIPCQSCTWYFASVPTCATVHSVDCEPVRCPQSSVRVKIAARDVAKHILGGTLKFAQIKELVAEHGLGLSDLKVVISVLDYVLKGAVKFNVDTADFATELEQLGECSLPAPCLAPWLHALTCGCPVPMLLQVCRVRLPRPCHGCTQHRRRLCAPGKRHGHCRYALVVAPHCDSSCACRYCTLTMMSQLPRLASLEWSVDCIVASSSLAVRCWLRLSTCEIECSSLSCCCWCCCACVCVCVCACVRLPTGRVRADSAPEAGDHAHPQLSGTARCGQCWSWRGCRCWRWCVEWTRQAFHHGSRTRQVPRVAQRAEASAAAHEELVGGGATKGAQHHVSHFTHGVHPVARPMHHGG